MRCSAGRMSLTIEVKMLYNTTYCTVARKQCKSEPPLKKKTGGRLRERMTQALLPAHPSVYSSIWITFVWMSLILQLLPQQISVPPLPLPTCCWCQLSTETVEVPRTWGRNMLASAVSGAHSLAEINRTGLGSMIDASHCLWMSVSFARRTGWGMTQYLIDHPYFQMVSIGLCVEGRSPD